VFNKQCKEMEKEEKVCGNCKYYKDLGIFVRHRKTSRPYCDVPNKFHFVFPEWKCSCGKFTPKND